MVELEKEAQKAGLAITKGGRFYHLMSQGQDKGRALLLTQKIYEKKSGRRVQTVALGDGGNDFSMLSVSDFPVLIPTYQMEYNNTEIPNHIKAPYPGPKGWNVVVKELFHVG